MELTQRLECTQELSQITNDKIYPDQIGFLGICGQKYPLKKGPNKVGRDPDTCSIVLDVNSISRQHAVINVLSKHEFMLMDLDSANKTKLSGKTLLPYMPSPLRNGDMVQFGQVFGVFRLFEDENDLPMTQAIDVLETPIQSKCVSKLNIQVTTIPESPDVSDRDDSFIGASQQRQSKSVFKSPRDNFLKTSGKTISIKPIGSNKIDNVYWTSSKKSESFTSQPNISNNLDSSIAPHIHELETQIPYDGKDCSIYNALTQIGPDKPLSIHEMETQLPADLPEVCKIDDQENIHFDFSISENKENENILVNAETHADHDSTKCSSLDTEKSKEKLNVSNDVILFDEIDSPPMEDNLESQSLMIPNVILDNVNLTHQEETGELDKKEINNENINLKSNHRQSSDSTDCEDDIFIAMTQKIHTVANDDDIMDCEDEPEPDKKNNDKQKVPDDDDVTDCEDELENIEQANKEPENVNIEDMCTQVIEELPAINKDDDECENKKDISEKSLEDLQTQVIEEHKNDSGSIADLETQVIEIAEDPQPNVCFEEALTQKIYSEEIVNFKMPVASPLRSKRKTLANVEKELSFIVQDGKADSQKNSSDNDDVYYMATQEIVSDLCSQKDLSPEIVKQPTIKLKTSKSLSLKSPNQKGVKPVNEICDYECDIDERINSFVASLNESQISDAVDTKPISNNDGQESKASEKNKASDKMSLKDELKGRPGINENQRKEYRKLLPNESKVKSESDKDSVLNTNEIKKKNDIRLYLNKNPEEQLPSRSSSRIRKPTSKFRNGDEESQKLCNSLFKPILIVDDTDPKKDNISDNTTQSKKEMKGKKEKKKGNKEEPGIKKRKTKKDEKDSNKNKKEEIIGDDMIQKNIEIEHKPRRSKRTKEKIEKPKYYESEDHIDDVKGKRNSRSRSKRSENDKKSVSPSNVKQRNENKNRKKSGERERKSPEKEVRRSRRHRTSKKSEEPSNEKQTQKLSNGHEQSTVYNLSSESGIDSPNKLKRSGDFEYPSAKKTKTVASLRSTPARKIKTHHVLFTAFPCDEVKVKLEKLGAIIVTEVTKCTVVLTMQIKRTFKLLCAVGLGKPIVGPTWVQACADTCMIVDPWLHLIKDEATEKRFQFNLERSLVGKRNFLSGYNISSTPSVLPGAEEMKLIVECSGGNWKDQGPLWICVSCLADKALWPTLKKKGAIIVSTEFILGGVLRQKLDIDRNRLM